MKRAIVCALVLASSGIASADPQVLRMAAIAPDGTAWARELKALAREIEFQSKGELRMKWYLGGIAGDELTAVERVRKNQLDGVAGAIFCQSLAPSLRGTNIPGLFHGREEALYTLNRMRPMVDEEMRKNGFANLGDGDFGFDIVLSRKPVRSMDDWKRGRFWTWNLNPVWKSTLTSFGVPWTESSVEEASRVLDEKKLDGLVAFPVAALAYQWSTQMQYYTNLPMAFLPACLVMSNSTFDALPLDRQTLLRSTVTKFFIRFNDVSGSMEDALVGGLFEKQGLKRVEPSESFRREFREAALRARDALPEALVPKALIQKLAAWQAEFQKEKHATREGR